MSSRLGFDVQAAAGDYKEEQFLPPAIPQTTASPPPCVHLSFFGGCAYLIPLSFSLILALD